MELVANPGRSRWGWGGDKPQRDLSTILTVIIAWRNTTHGTAVGAPGLAEAKGPSVIFFSKKKEGRSQGPAAPSGHVTIGHPRPY